MFIKIEELEEKPLHVRHLFPVNEIRFSHEDAWLETPVAVDFVLYPSSGRELRAAGSLETSVRYRCSRCTREFVRPLAGDFDLSYSPQPEWDGTAEIELKYEDMDIGYYDGVRFDVNALALERIELAIPMQHVCRDDCKGLCYKCGVDLNEETCLCKEEPDARFAVLLEGTSKNSKIKACD